MRKRADSALQAALHDYESLNMEMVWTAVDLYRQSIILTRDQDIENEAISNSSLGQLFHSVVPGYKARGMKFFERAI